MGLLILPVILIFILIVSGCTQTGYIAQRAAIADEEPSDEGIDKRGNVSAEVNGSEGAPDTSDVQEPQLQESAPSDPCEEVVCQDSVTTCPDGFVSRCSNSCSEGECTSCTPSCVGHQAPADPCAGVTCQPSSVTCPDGFVATCQNSCSSGQCSSCQPDCAGHDVVQAGSILINELMYNPMQNENYNEWIELFNPSSSPVNLEGWELCSNDLLPGYIDKNGATHQESGLLIPSNGYAVITDGGSGTEVYENFNVYANAVALHVDASSLCGGLTNTGKTIELKNQGQTIDTVSYSNSLGANGNGKTLEHSGGQWLESSVDGGTPGIENSG